MIVTYLGHSGFAVRWAAGTLLFDYVGDSLAAPPNDTVAFISHAHDDHNGAAVRRWFGEGRLSLVTGDDLDLEQDQELTRQSGAGFSFAARSGGEGALEVRRADSDTAAGEKTSRDVAGMPGIALDGVRMRPGEACDLPGLHIEAYGSTDRGVSFLVRAGGYNLYHAGDYNFWHWRAESTPSEVREAERAFTDILETLRGQRIDAAFFPVDPRLGAGYDEGALRFAEVIRPALLLPMHFWDQPEAARAFARRPMPAGTRVCALTEIGAAIEI